MSHKMDAIGVTGLMALFQCSYSLAGDLPPSWINWSKVELVGFFKYNVKSIRIRKEKTLNPISTLKVIARLSTWGSL